MRAFFRVFAAVANLAVVDAVAKELAASLLAGSASVAVVPGFFDLAYVENRGCAWGLFQGQVWPLAAFGVVALAALVWKRRDVFLSFGGGWRRAFGSVAEPLLYAGIVGNLVDRVFRGFVIDFLDFHWGVHHFPCFNLADAYITVAAALLVVASFGVKAESGAGGKSGGK